MNRHEYDANEFEVGSKQNMNERTESKLDKVDYDC